MRKPKSLGQIAHDTWNGPKNWNNKEQWQRELWEETARAVENTVLRRLGIVTCTRRRNITVTVPKGEDE